MRSRRQFVLGLAGASAAIACGSSPRPETAASAQSARRGPPDGTDPGRPLPERPLGKTGVNVSMLGLGGFHIGQQASERESISLIQKAIDQGVTFLDNCWDYNDGQSELRMGKALASGYRQRAFLMTKIDGRTRAAATAQLEQSLSRLQTDMIDLVQVHEVIRASDPERCFAPGGAIEALVAARDAGKLRFIGFTGHKHPDIHLAMLDAARKNGFTFDAVQMPLNVMDAHYESFEARVLPILIAQKIGVLGMKSLGGGDILKSGVVTAEECLRYALSLPTSVVITGMDNDTVLDENVALARRFEAVSPEERESLLARTLTSAQGGKHELFKTSEKYDGTARNPHWLERAEL